MTIHLSSLRLKQVIRSTYSAPTVHNAYEEKCYKKAYPIHELQGRTRTTRFIQEPIFGEMSQ